MPPGAKSIAIDRIDDVATSLLVTAATRHRHHVALRVVVIVVMSRLLVQYMVLYMEGR